MNIKHFFMKMGNETAYLKPPNTIFFFRGAASLQPSPGPAPLAPANTLLSDCPSHKRAQMLEDNRGKWATPGI